jgi:hypothetical protein
MKAQLKTRKITYWSCGKDTKGHFHSTEDFALRCIAKQGDTPFADKCAATLIRNKKIISRFIEVKQKAQTARDTEVSSGVVGNVITSAMHICHSNPLGAFRYTRRTDDGRYYAHSRSPAHTTIALSFDEIRALVKIWEESDNSWWIFLCGLSDHWEHRDGLPLYRYSDKEIDAMDMPE